MEWGDVCPEQYQEVIGVNQYRFCLALSAPDIKTLIMPKQIPDVAGMPFERALTILKRHEDELLKLPAKVTEFRFSPKGVVIFTDADPAILPKSIDGLPIISFQLKLWRLL